MNLISSTFKVSGCVSLNIIFFSESKINNMFLYRTHVLKKPKKIFNNLSLFDYSLFTVCCRIQLDGGSSANRQTKKIEPKPDVLLPLVASPGGLRCLWQPYPGHRSFYSIVSFSCSVGGCAHWDISSKFVRSVKTDFPWHNTFKWIM